MVAPRRERDSTKLQGPLGLLPCIRRQVGRARLCWLPTSSPVLASTINHRSSQRHQSGRQIREPLPKPLDDRYQRDQHKIAGRCVVFFFELLIVFSHSGGARSPFNLGRAPALPAVVCRSGFRRAVDTFNDPAGPVVPRLATASADSSPSSFSINLHTGIWKQAGILQPPCRHRRHLSKVASFGQQMDSPNGVGNAV